MHAVPWRNGIHGRIPAGPVLSRFALAFARRGRRRNHAWHHRQVRGHRPTAVKPGREGPERRSIVVHCWRYGDTESSNECPSFRNLSVATRGDGIKYLLVDLMALREWFRVRVSDLGIHLDVSPPNRAAWQADIPWSEIVRVCYKAED